MWQKTFERHRSAGFTVVGIALDAEGIEPAKRYYERFGVKFPALVDPNYATGFGAVPKTFFVNEHGVVQPLRNWEEAVKPASELKAVASEVRKQWSTSGARLDSAEVARLLAIHRKDSRNLSVAVDLASRYMDLQLGSQAQAVLNAAVKQYDSKRVARSESGGKATLLGQAYLQLSRASQERDDRVRFATMSYYLNPSVGFGKQIARIIAPEKFDGRPLGDFDNAFREGTLRRLKRERADWLKAD